jgi:hypothetical protein
MTTIKLKVNERVLEKVLWLLSQFTPDDLEVVTTEDEFATQKAELQKELNRYETGEARVFSVNEADQLLERTIREYES